MPIRLALIHVTDAQQHLLRQMRTHDLHADGQPVRDAARDRQRRDARQIHRDHECTSDKYISSGLVIFSPIRNAVVGATGVMSASQVSNAFSKSWRISVRTFCAFK
jgi:hypothetical protein